MKTISFFTSILFLLTLQSAHGVGLTGAAQSASASVSDHRQLISMPEGASQLMRKDMLDHLLALNEIIGHITENNLDAAADIAETRIGKSSMGKHRGTGMGPGRFMPPQMRNIGWSMHAAATELSEAAKQGDLKATNIALGKITATCVACHYSFRTR